VLILANVVAALALVGTASAYGYVQWRLDQIKRINVAGLSPSSGDGNPIPAFNLLIIGSDTRALSGPGNAQFGSQAQSGGQRSDSIILLRVVPKTRSLGLFSIPRDTLVRVPGYGVTRINAAFNAGTPSLLVQVLQQDFGIQVNHVALFNFDTFEAIDNAIGGVYQWFPTPARDQFSNLGEPAGCQLLNGTQALAFARSREYQYFLNGSWHYQMAPESDLGRIQRQQAFVKLAVAKALKVAPTNPVTLNKVIAGLTKNLTLDSGFSNSLIFSLARDFHSAGLTNVPSFTYPTVNSTSVSGALDPQTAQGAQMIQQWLNVGPPPPAASPATTSAPPITTVKPSSVSIEVVNGSGVPGQAGQASSELHGLGYNSTVDAAAGTSGNAGTVIDYAPDALAAAKQVQAQLAVGATLTEDASLTPTVYNLKLVTGTDFRGFKGSPAPATGATATTASPQSTAIAGAAAVTPDSSSFYKGRYIPPGRVAGQIPATCPT
jgi:LCP family protein required for cell wall assembly